MTGATQPTKLTKDQKIWRREIDLLREFASAEFLQIELRNPVHPEYQIAKLIGEGVRLVIYPHTTRSTFNQHARVRDEGSKNKDKAKWLMAKLDAFTGFNCTFSHKHSNWHDTELKIKARAELIKEGRVNAPY